MWATGTYDPDLNLVYFGTGNPGPDYHGDSREGDNLYSDSLVALDADTGKLRWHYQFTPHDVHDWDSTHVPILGDITIGGQPRKVVMVANRNGFFYTLDRATGELLVAKPFVETTWAKEIGSDGRPILLPGHTPDEKGDGHLSRSSPAAPTSVRRRSIRAAAVLRQRARSVRDLLRVEAGIQAGRAVHRRRRPARRRGRTCTALRRAARDRSGHRRAQVGVPPPQPVARRACSRPRRAWCSAGDDEGNLLALDSRTGKLLWRYQMGANLHGTSPVTYMLDGRQHLLVPAGTTLTAWALPDVPRRPNTP